MIQVDVPIAFAIGGALASAAHRQIETGDVTEFRLVLLKTNYYLMFFYCWVPVYFTVNYFGWETSHLWWHADDVKAYPFFIPTLLLSIFALGNCGVLAGARLVKSGHLGLNRLLYLSTFLYAFFWVIANHSRTSRLGNYQNWAQATVFYHDSRFLFAFICTMIIWIGAFIGFVIHFSRAGTPRMHFSASR